MRPNRLLFVVNVDWFFISHRLPIALKAISDGYEVHIACHDTGDFQFLTEMGLIVHPIYFSRSGGFFFNELKTLFKLRKIISNVEPCLIHSITIKPVLYTGLVLYLFKNKPKFVVAISGLGYLFSAVSLKARITKFIVSFLYYVSFKHRNIHVIFQNNNDKKILSGITNLSSTESSLIKGSGADLDLYSFTKEPDTKTIRVTMACRLLKEKGVYVFVNAAKIVHSKISNVEFILAGTPDLDNPHSVLQSELNEWCDSGIIKVLGHCNDIPSLFSESHIVTLPSYYGEGVPKVLIEAAACGRPIVTTNNPGCQDSVIPDITGLLVPSKDPEKLAEALIKLIQNNDLRRKMGYYARKYAINEFDVRNVVRNHLKIYDDLLNK